MQEMVYWLLEEVKIEKGKYIVNNIFVNNSVFDRGNIRAFWTEKYAGEKIVIY